MQFVSFEDGYYYIFFLPDNRLQIIWTKYNKIDGLFSNEYKFENQKENSRAFGKFILFPNVSHRGAENLAQILAWLSSNLLFRSLASSFPDLPLLTSLICRPILFDALYLINVSAILSVR